MKAEQVIAMQDNFYKRRKLAILAVVSAAALLIATGLAAMYAGQAFFQAYAFHGSRFDPPPAAADFTLTDQNGQAVRLSDYRGKFVLLFFGYTHCPDECPTTLAMLNRALSEMKDAGSSTQVLLVSVDPEEDTPPVLKEYLARFNPSFVGLTGQPAEVEAVLKAYGVAVQKDGGTISHATRIYVIDRAGRLALTYSFETQPEEVAADLEHLSAQ
jgi:protein SCO1/2